MTDHTDHEHEHEHEEEHDVPVDPSAGPAPRIPSTLFLSAGAVAAAQQFRVNNPEWQTMPLRVYLSGKGCDGFDYGVCFDQRDPGDHFFTQDSIEFVCDPETFKFIAGATIDFVDDERGRGFVVENPRHKQFRGKFYKRKGWEERLKI